MRSWLRIPDLYQPNSSIMKSSMKLLHWTPRILCILAIIFLSLFALDAFEEGMPIGKQILGFLIHMIPSFVLIIFLIIAWKWEFIGGIIFMAVGIIFSPIIFNMNYSMNESIWVSIGIIASITFPFIIVGVLFVVNYYQKKKEKKHGAGQVSTN